MNCYLILKVFGQDQDPNIVLKKEKLKHVYNYISICNTKFFDLVAWNWPYLNASAHLPYGISGSHKTCHAQDLNSEIQVTPEQN